MKSFERRMGVSGLEVREASDVFTLEGYASTYNEPYSMGYYTEVIAPTAFKRTLGQKPDVRLLINHAGLPLARTTSGTLTLDSDKRGLHVKAELDPSDPDVASLVPKMRRGDLSQMSFGFGIIETEWSSDYTTATRTQLDLQDGDVSVVTYPANPGTSVAVRSEGRPSADGLASMLRDMERRAAPPEAVVSVLTRALGYFQAGEIATAVEVAGETTETTEDDDERAARIALEFRKRRLLIAG